MGLYSCPKRTAPPLSSSTPAQLNIGIKTKNEKKSLNKWSELAVLELENQLAPESNKVPIIDENSDEVVIVTVSTLPINK